MRAGVGIGDVSAFGNFLDGCFSTGAAARFRTDRIKRAERFLFYELDPFPRAPPPPPRVCSGGGQEWELQGKSGPPLPQTSHRPQLRPQPSSVTPRLVDSCWVQAPHSSTLYDGRFLRVHCSHEGPNRAEHSCGFSQMAGVSGIDCAVIGRQVSRSLVCSPGFQLPCLSAASPKKLATWGRRGLCIALLIPFSN